jgi:HNH endonuclease
MLIEGFQVHHMDGDHSNDSPDNLVLIEAADHMMLHGMNRLKFVPNRMRKKQPKKIGIREQQRRERFAAYKEGNKCLKQTQKGPGSLNCLEPSAA